MFAPFLVAGMACWLAMVSLAEAAPADQTDASPLFDNLGSLHHPFTTTSEQAQRYFDQGLRLVYACGPTRSAGGHALLGDCAGARSQHQ
jgi:hypothetical protein